jgi:hypothetical protein
VLNGDDAARAAKRPVHSTFNIQHSTFNILLLLLAFPLFANDLQVDRHTLSVDESLTITITLTDSFAFADNVSIPLQNLVVDGSPSVSSEFSWINGQSTRRKVFRYAAHPRGPGPALIGPIVLHSGDGQVETLAPVSIQVLPDLAAGSNDPARILHELLATGRDPIFLVAEADKSSVFVGEQVIVTWTIYNATNVQQQGLGEFPKFADFWTEELDVRGETMQQVVVGGAPMQKLVIRRVALFPLRSGTLTVEPMSIEGQILKRSDIGNPFGMFEGTLVDVHRRAAPLTIESRPVPPGVPVAAVGDVSMRCLTPVQKNGGPVSVEVELSGRANLRAAAPPAFTRAVEGSVQIEEGGVSVQRRDALMTRRWRFLIFPSSSGMFVIPPLATTILRSAGVRGEVRCEERTLLVEAADVSAVAPPLSANSNGSRFQSARRFLPVAAGIALLVVIVLALAEPRVRRTRRVRETVRGLVRETPAATRVAADEWLVSRGADPLLLVREHSERGDAYRALRSLIDGAERDRLVAERGELDARVKALVAEMV